MLAKLALGVLGGTALAGAYLVHEGAVRVSVDENRPGGTHLHLLLPAAGVPLALRCVPEEKLCSAAANAQTWLPAVRAASRALAKLPDADLVEVRDAREHVRMSKRDGAILVDIESPEETVHISVPLRTLARVAEQLESLAPAS